MREHVNVVMGLVATALIVGLGLRFSIGFTNALLNAKTKEPQPPEIIYVDSVEYFICERGSCVPSDRYTHPPSMTTSAAWDNWQWSADHSAKLLVKEVHMRRCQDPLCSKVISVNRSYVQIEGKVYCGLECRKSWEIANTALQFAAYPFRNSPMAARYRDPVTEPICTEPAPEPGTA